MLRLIRGATLIAVSAVAGAAHARSAGLAALGCDGCHGGGEPAKVTLAVSPLNAAVGEPVTLTIGMPQANGASAGFYLTTAFEARGYFGAVEAGTAVDTSGVFHTKPRLGSDGITVFEAQWTATEPTGVTFDVYALSANGDRTTRGDGAGTARISLAIGCSGQRYYIDQDGDGYGSADPAFAPRTECVEPSGYAARVGDCDDFRADVHPDAAELCDLRDNDCDGEADDEVVSQPYCEDGDGDGHGVVGLSTKMDCKPSSGYGTCDGDCDDADARFHPGAIETCDLRDNDCDGEADEGVRPICGLGLCARRARDCTLATCTPGEPAAETCNGYDDDCDGVVDDGGALELCADSGQRCVGGRCVADANGGSGGYVAPGLGGAGSQAGSSSSSSRGGCSAVGPPPTRSGWGVALSLALAACARRRIRTR